MQWRVPRGMIALKVAAAALFVVLALLTRNDPPRVTIALAAAAVVGGFALRDLIAPVRLAVDGDGLTVVTGFARRRHIRWADVERIRVDTHKRLGLRTELLEIDTGTALHLLSTYDLGARCDEVADALLTFRTGRP